MPRGLEASRWATTPDSYRINKRRERRRQTLRSTSTPSSLSASQSDNFVVQAQPSPEQELSRFHKIVARLNWKLPFLKQGYNLAKDTFGKEQSQVEAYEIQFKLDFHEFYMLLERALVRLMSIFGIVVKGNGIMINGNVRVNTDSDSNVLNESDHPHQHWYHSNVLAALDDRANPLKDIFGAYEVRQQLSRAKDLRNRWKNIDEAEPRKYPPPPLSTYNLDHIVDTILAAIDRGHSLAMGHIRRNGGEPTKDAGTATGETDWDFMVDAMDWEAV